MTDKRNKNFLSIKYVYVFYICLTISVTAFADKKPITKEQANAFFEAAKGLKMRPDPIRVMYPQKPEESDFDYSIRITEIAACEGANQLEFMDQLPHMTQTYGTCFGVTAAQMGDYLRLESGQNIYMPTRNDVAAIMVDRLQMTKNHDTSNFPTSFFVAALDYYVAEARGDDISILDRGGYFDHTLEQMAKSGGCPVSMYELMPSNDRKIFVEGLGGFLKNLDMISKLPPQEAWIEFEKHFGDYLWLTNIPKENFQKDFNMKKWPEQKSMIAKIKMAFEKMACPVRDIVYPSFSIKKIDYSQPKDKLEILRSVKYRDILKWLKTKKRPIPIYFCSSVINNPKFKGLDIGINRLNSDECQPHAVLVVGAEYIESAKQCKLKIRNWWGADYKYLDQLNPDGKGNFYLTREQIIHNVYRTYFIGLE